MRRDDLRVKVKERRPRMSGWVEEIGHRPVTDAELASLGYVRVEAKDARWWCEWHERFDALRCQEARAGGSSRHEECGMRVLAKLDI